MRHEPVVMSFGSVSLISPDGSGDIPDALWPELAAAVFLEPEPDLLAKWVADLEQKLGVNEAHRLAVRHGSAEVRAFIAADQQAKGLRQPEGGKVWLPDHERGVGADRLRQLDRLNRKLARDDLSPKERDRLLDERDGLERAPREAAEASEVARGLDETQALADARGEESTTERGGVRRILDRDPLLSLFRAGAITDRQLEAGQAVRELYDLRRSDAAAIQYDGQPAGRHDHERFIGQRFLRAKTTIPAAQLETAILNGHYRVRTGELIVLKRWPDYKAAGMEPHVSLQTLRFVCGEHKTLTSLGRGRAYERHKQALGWALDVAYEVLDGPRSGIVPA